LIAVLLRIVESPNFDAKVTFEANSLLDKWRIFDTHLTSFLLLRVYSTLRSASEYLQAEGLDYLSAWNMVEKAKEVLKNLNFENIMKTTTKIIEAVNQMFDDDEETDFAIEGGIQEDENIKKETNYW
jgi:hypothetical protein